MSEAMDLHEESERGRGPGPGSEAPEAEREGIDALRASLEEADRWTRHFVREHPVASIAVAAGAGFLVGRIAARYL